MFGVSSGIFFIALTTLMLELALVRVFDVIWYSNMAYMVVTLAMFCFGLSGILVTFRPGMGERNIRSRLVVLSGCFGIASLLILPSLNFIPFDFDILYQNPLKGTVWFLVMYFFLILPFFLAGLIFSLVFSHYSEQIQTLYCWDLTGAAIGCLVLVPFLPPIGPGGILFLACALALLAAGCFTRSTKIRWGAMVVAVAVAAVPFFHEGYFDFRQHINKRGVKRAEEKNFTKDSRWDPISKIDVINFGTMLHLAYDGGSQSSYIFPFNGDFEKLRENVDHNQWKGQFYNQKVFISHSLKKDSDAEVLVIGAAGGSETKAALMYGAGHVDAVELVGYVLDLGKNKYAKYNGNIYNNPKVNAIRGEGRSFLRATSKKYDIIQIYSNHTSSSIAAGSGAMATTYLQTAEAYEEYFSHLKPDGILHINHHVYPKMVTTAALAWKRLGLKDFARHVLVKDTGHDSWVDNLPTLLVKMTPWTAEEVAEVNAVLRGPLVVDPLHPEKNMLTAEFFSGDLSAATEGLVPFRIGASTDDRPYFNHLRKVFGIIEADDSRFVNHSTAGLLNSQLRNDWIPTDIVHLIVTGFASIFFTLVFLLVPLLFSRVGKSRWPGKVASLVYFSCLGAGFILFELVFIQIFMKLIGYPLYTYSTVVFAMLLAAGLGSRSSGLIGIAPRTRWLVPFIGVILFATVFLLAHDSYFELFLQSSIGVRIAAAIALIFPVGFFLGMPFPMGILALKDKPNGAIAWAWAMNGLFTVIGGLGSVMLSIQVGFQVTIMVALGIYLLAFVAFSRLRLTVI